VTEPNRPAGDLRPRLAKPDGHLFQSIGDGVPGTDMPDFRETLAPEDRWRLVAYIRRLTAEGGR